METTLLIMSKEDQEVISEWLTFYFFFLKIYD